MHPAVSNQSVAVWKLHDAALRACACLTRFAPEIMSISRLDCTNKTPTDDQFTHLFIDLAVQCCDKIRSVKWNRFKKPHTTQIYKKKSTSIISSLDLSGWPLPQKKKVHLIDTGKENHLVPYLEFNVSFSPMVVYRKSWALQSAVGRTILRWMSRSRRKLRCHAAENTADVSATCEGPGAEWGTRSAPRPISVQLTDKSSTSNPLSPPPPSTHWWALQAPHCNFFFRPAKKPQKTKYFSSLSIFSDVQLMNKMQE